MNRSIFLAIVINLVLNLDAFGGGVGTGVKEQRDIDGSTPLHIALWRNIAFIGDERKVAKQTEVSENLIWNGADVNAKDNFGRTPLHLAAKAGNIQLVAALLRKGADINSVDKNKRTPLHEAIVIGRMSGDMKNVHYDLASNLISRGADVNAVDSWGQTPLFLTTSWPSDYYFNLISGLLIKKGAKLDINNNKQNEKKPSLEPSLKYDPDYNKDEAWHRYSADIGVYLGPVVDSYFYLNEKSRERLKGLLARTHEKLNSTGDSRTPLKEKLNSPLPLEGEGSTVEGSKVSGYPKFFFPVVKLFRDVTRSLSFSLDGSLTGRCTESPSE